MYGCHIISQVSLSSKTHHFNRVISYQSQYDIMIVIKLRRPLWVNIRNHEVCEAEECVAAASVRSALVCSSSGGAA